MDKVNYETYDTDAVYDDMDQNTSAEKVNAIDRAPQQKREARDKGRSGNKRLTCILVATIAVLLLLLVIGAAVGFSVKQDIEAADCDVGAWEAWTSCYVPPGTCGIGKQNRTRS